MLYIYGENINSNNIDNYIKNNYHPLSWMYCDGILQDANGYDIIWADAGSFDIIELVTDKNIFDAIFTTYDGKEFEATFYIWYCPNHKMRKGIIVSKNDNKAIEYALHHYNNRNWCINGKGIAD